MTVPLTTTLAAIKSHGPCADGWRILVAALNAKHASGIWPMDGPFPLSWILDSNGYEHGKWALRTLCDDSPILRLWLADCAEHVLPIFERWNAADDRPRKAIEATRRYAAIQLGADGDARAAEAARAAWAAEAAEAARAAEAAEAAEAAWAAEAAEAAEAAWAAEAAGAAGAAEAAEAAWAARAAENDWQCARLRFYLDGHLPAPILRLLNRAVPV